MAPAHMAPVVAKGIELEKQVVLPVEENGAVGVVDPVGRRVEMELRLPGGNRFRGGRRGRRGLGR